MKIRLSLLTLILLPFLAFSQNKSPDSLQNALKIAKTDSARYMICKILVRYYTEKNWDSALYYAEKSVSIAETNNHSLDVASALDGKGYILMHLGKVGESLRCFLKAIPLAENAANENKTWKRYANFTPRKTRLDILSNLHHDFGHLMGRTGDICLLYTSPSPRDS